MEMVPIFTSSSQLWHGETLTMRRLFLAGLFVMATGATLGAEDDSKLKSLLDKAVEVRHARLARIKNMSCSFRRETSAAPDTIASIAKGKNM